jgi:hypothetical protein
MMMKTSYLRTLFLQAPSFDGFDGGAGSRYQAKREIRSFWYPTWLAQPAALVPGSRLLDAPADGLTVEQALDAAKDYELVIIHTSTPSFPSDARFAELIKERSPGTLVGMVGAKVAVDAEGSLQASRAIDFVAREEFDYTCRDIAEGRPLQDIAGISWRDSEDRIRHNPARPIIQDMDALPFVAPVYQRDLDIHKYFIGYLNYPYVSLYTGRGCRSRCTFCLWPQTVGGHRYRTRSAANVLAEVRWIRDNMPEVKEIMFDDDTFTDFRPRAEEIARGLGELGVTWSCNAKANVPYSTLKIMKDNGLRLLLVGYESGDDHIHLNIKNGPSRPTAARSASRSTAPSSSGCPARPARPSPNRSPLPRRSTRTRYRCRWPRPTPARACTSRRWRTAGSHPTRSSTWSTRAGCSWRRSAIPTCRAKRSTTASNSSTAASTSTRPRSGKSSARCWAAGR